MLTDQGRGRRMRICGLAFAVLSLAPYALAQHPPDVDQPESEGERPFEILGGYSLLHESGSNLNGWTGTFIANVNHWFGIAADFDGHYGSHLEGSTNVLEQEHGFTFGPHVALHNRSRFTPFAFALFGGAHESVPTAGYTESATAFAANLGGGVDFGMNDRVSLRLAQVDAAYACFHGQCTASPRFSAGLVFHLGKPK
jgi:hypothetical protein